MTPRSPETPALRLALGAALLAGTALLAIPAFVHSDDGDAQLYQVVTRHMVEDHTWTNLRYLGNVFTVFREHLPFGFWPYALAVRAFGEGALGPVALGFSISTLLLVAFAARRLAGDGAALVAVISLAACDSFWSLGGRPRLDPPLVLFANLAALPVLLGPRRATGFLWAWVFGTCAALIKGPFGLVPLTAAAIGQASVGRWRTFLLGGVVTAAATIPMVAFLVHDRSHGGTWWHGYVENQLLASATGGRSDGEFAFYVPLRTVLTRFWPGLPLLAIGVWRLFRRGGDEAQRPALKLLAVFGSRDGRDPLRADAEALVPRARRLPGARDVRGRRGRSSARGVARAWGASGAQRRARARGDRRRALGRQLHRTHPAHLEEAVAVLQRARHPRSIPPSRSCSSSVRNRGMRPRPLPPSALPSTCGSSSRALPRWCLAWSSPRPTRAPRRCLPTTACFHFRSRVGDERARTRAGRCCSASRTFTDARAGRPPRGAVRSFRRMSENPIFHVAPDGLKGGWRLERIGTGEAEHFDTREAAEARAGALASELGEDAKVLVHDERGAIADERTEKAG